MRPLESAAIEQQAEAKPTRRRIEDRPWVNPYVAATKIYPGQLYPIDDEPSELEALRIRLADVPSIAIELGSGSGSHLIEQARRRPETLFVGFELRYKRAVRTIEKARESGLDNLILARGDARQITHVGRPGSVESIYVNFPDPWEKRKRWKHRLLAPWLLDAAAVLLTPCGEMRVKTDHQDYFDWFCDAVDAHASFVVTESSNDLYASDYAASSVATEFEKLFRSQGLPIYYARLARSSQRSGKED